MVLLLLALLQSPSDRPLVGDTVWIDREVRAPAGSLLRPLPWDPGQVASLLGAPVVEVRTDGWVLRYPLVFWEPGRHRLQVPGPLVIREDGRTDSLPARAVEVEIASLVPSAAGADTVPPRPPAEILPVGERSIQPLVVLLLLASMVLGPLQWWWRRRGRVAPATPIAARQVLPSPETLATWAGLGEWRLVADSWIARLEAQGGEAASGRLLEELRAARFGGGDATVLEELCREAAAR